MIPQTFRFPDANELLRNTQAVADRSLAVAEHRLRKFNIRRETEKRLQQMRNSYKHMNRIAAKGSEVAEQEMRRIEEDFHSFKSVLKTMKVGAKVKDEMLSSLPSRHSGDR